MTKRIFRVRFYIVNKLCITIDIYDMQDAIDFASKMNGKIEELIDGHWEEVILN